MPVSFKQQFDVLKAAVAANPQLQLALGVAGIGAVTSIVLLFAGGDRELAIIGGLFVIGFMFLLAIFISVTSPSGLTTRPVLAGFLVWSISAIFICSLVAMFLSFFVCWPQPFGRNCQIPRLNFINESFLNDNFARLVNNGAEHYYYLDKVEKKPGGDFFISDFSKSVFVVSGLVRNYTVDKDGSISVTVSVTISDSQGVIDVKTSREYTSPTAWQKEPFKIPSRIGASAFKEQMRQNGFPISDTDIPFVLAIGCMKERSGMTGKIRFDILAMDAKAGTFARPNPLDANVIQTNAAALPGTKSCG